MSSKPVLKLDWCSHEAAKYACEKWHYSGCLSSSTNVYCGAWEDDKFIGAIVFGIGAGNVTKGSCWGLERRQMAELTRVALTSHRSPVSRMLRISSLMISRQSPGIRMLVSMADPRQEHHGGIYQGAGWIYTGTTKPDVEYFLNGKWRHHRTVTSSRSAAGLPSRPIPGKHRYLMPLDAEMRAKILPLAKPYPKRVRSEDSGTSGDQPEGGGANPTRTL